MPGAVAFGLAAAIPVLVATLQAFRLGWAPGGDDGVIVLRAFDVLSAHPPLVGQYSQASPLTGHATYSPGPLLYWWLAVPAHLGGRMPIVAMGALSTLSVLGVVLVARRLGGPLLMVAAALTMVATAWALPVEVPYEVWNCWAAAFAFTLLPFLAWAVGTGHYRLLPLLAAVASFVVQCHLTYVAPTLVAVAVAAVGLALWLRRSAPAPTGSRPRPVRRWVAAAALVGLVCWSAPLVEQVEHRPGNGVRLSQLATNGHPTLGSRAARNAVAATVGVPPLWLAGARRPSDRIEIVGRSPSPVSGVSACLVLGGLALCCGLAWRRRRHDLVVGTALALGLCAALVPTAATIPAGPLGFAVEPYVLIWMVSAGMFAWLVLGWATVELVRPAPRLLVARPGTSLAAAMAVVAAAGVAASARRAADPQRLPPQIQDYRLIREAMGRVEDATAGDRAVFVDVRTPDVASELPSAILYALRRRGSRVVVAPRVATYVGAHYAGTQREADAVVHVAGAGSVPPRGARVLLAGGGYVVSLSRPPP